MQREDDEPIRFVLQLQHDCAWRCWAMNDIDSTVATAEGQTPAEALENCEAKVSA